VRAHGHMEAIDGRASLGVVEVEHRVDRTLVDRCGAGARVEPLREFEGHDDGGAAWVRDETGSATKPECHLYGKPTLPDRGGRLTASFM
jgi:hypothetical protein